MRGLNRGAFTMRSLLFIAFASSSLSIFACGGDSSSQTDGGDEASATDGGGQDVIVEAAPDVDNGAPSSTYPAFKVDAPQVMSGGGPVLATPKVVPVYFANDDTTFTGNVTAFLGKLGSSTFWGPTPPALTEYGVGALSTVAPVQLTENAPGTIDDTAIQSWLAGKMTDPAWPTADVNTIYTIFYPTGSTITLQGQSSCSSFGGYHNNIKVGTQSIAYAVIPRCGKFGSLQGLDAVSAATSHELEEAATDPYPATNGAFSQVDDNHIIWMFALGGGEVGDMCAQSPDAYYAPTDIGNVVQRSWSNKSAKAGHNPCLPSDGLPYFNSMPVLTDKLTLGGGQLVSKGVTIPVGQSQTIEVDLFSDAATSGPWTVSALDTAQLQGQAPELKFDWDRTSGQNGEKLHLTITVLKASQYMAEGFIISSRLGTRENLWVGLVGN
jgi:hypothetical protein